MNLSQKKKSFGNDATEYNLGPVDKDEEEKKTNVESVTFNDTLNAIRSSCWKTQLPLTSMEVDL